MIKNLGVAAEYLATLKLHPLTVATQLHGNMTMWLYSYAAMWLLVQ